MIQLFGSVLKDYLVINDFDVTHAIDGRMVLPNLKESDYDLCILDVMMPEKKMVLRLGKGSKN